MDSIWWCPYNKQYSLDRCMNDDQEDVQMGDLLSYSDLSLMECDYALARTLWMLRTLWPTRTPPVGGKN